MAAYIIIQFFNNVNLDPRFKRTKYLYLQLSLVPWSTHSSMSSCTHTTVLLPLALSTRSISGGNATSHDYNWWDICHFVFCLIIWFIVLLYKTLWHVWINDLRYILMSSIVANNAGVNWISKDNNHFWLVILKLYNS